MSFVLYQDWSYQVYCGDILLWKRRIIHDFTVLMYLLNFIIVAKPVAKVWSLVELEIVVETVKQLVLFLQLYENTKNIFWTDMW